MFYFVAKAATERQLAEKRILLYQMQETWYESLNDYMEQTKRIRHDFRHIMITVGELVSSKQYENLEQYYKDYLLTSSTLCAPQIFCGNASLNALLSYYANIAADFNIKTQFQIQLPDTKRIPDIDFGILFGNLLENAIFACKSAAPSDRYIHLTKRNGSATGLVSIRAIAEKYRGTARFYYRNTEFISNIMMKV